MADQAQHVVPEVDTHAFDLHGEADGQAYTTTFRQFQNWVLGIATDVFQLSANNMAIESSLLDPISDIFQGKYRHLGRSIPAVCFLIQWLMISRYWERAECIQFEVPQLTDEVGRLEFARSNVRVWKELLQERKDDCKRAFLTVMETRVETTVRQFTFIEDVSLAYPEATTKPMSKEHIHAQRERHQGAWAILNALSFNLSQRMRSWVDYRRLSKIPGEGDAEHPSGRLTFRDVHHGGSPPHQDPPKAPQNLYYGMTWTTRAFLCFNVDFLVV